MKKTVKRLLVAFITALSCALVCLFTMGSGTVESVEPSLIINHFNLSFRNNVCVKYAVETNVENTQVLVWREVSDSYEKGTDETVLDSVGTQEIDGKTHQIFDYTELYVKNMTDDVYARAYAKVDGKDYYSPVEKYSILQYAYNKLGKTGEATEDEALKITLTKTLEYGGAVQTYLGYSLDRLATDNFVQVQVNGGALPDGFTHGLYKVGSTVTIAAPETNADGVAFTQWIDEANNVISETATYALAVGEANATYTPVYNTYSQGLVYTSNGDGTCSVTGIGTCTDTDIIIPSTSPEGDSVIAIGSRAFYNCSSLISIEIPDSVTTIGQYAFYLCRSLTSIEISDSVTIIGRSAFYGCSGLTSIKIPNSVTEIGSSAFERCSSLTKVNYTGTIDDWVMIDFTGALANPLHYAKKLYINNLEVTSAVLTAVTKISAYAFDGCSSLTSIEIPDSVTTIEMYAFSGCRSLMSIKIPNRVTSISQAIFEGCSSLASIEIPDSVTEVWVSAFRNCSSLTSIKIPNSVTSITPSVFEGCSSLTSVNIPDGVTSIGESAFSKCSSLTSIEIPNSVTAIKNSAFEGCSSLTSIEIPDSVTAIGDSAFNGCSGLTSIEIPGTVTWIGSSAFKGCSSLTSIEIPDIITLIGTSMFQGCSGLTRVNIPDGAGIPNLHPFEDNGVL